VGPPGRAGEAAEARGGGGERAPVVVAVDEVWDRGAGDAAPAGGAAAVEVDEMADEPERPLHWAGSAGREGCGARRNEPLSAEWFCGRAKVPRVRVAEGDEVPSGEG